MALKKETTLDTGYTANYWVAETTNNMRVKKTNIILYLYKDETTRKQNKPFVLRRTISELDGIYKTGDEIYQHIKNTPFYIDLDNTTQENPNWFADAEDC